MSLKSNCKIISVEGNIGSGKSTLVEAMRKHFEDNPNILFIQEPVQEWEQIIDKSGNTVLEKYYANQEKYAFSFQMMAYISRLSQLRNAMTKGYDTIITERCVFTDKMVFAKMLYDEGKIEDVNYQIYNKWFDEFLGELPEFKYIYLKTTPSVAKKRVDTRNRQGEESIPVDYLEQCHNYHDNWLLNADNNDKILMLDGEIDRNKHPEETSNLIRQIISFIDNESSYTIMFDGGSRGNPGPSGCGFVIYKDGKIIEQDNKFLGTKTNNYAEYTGLIIALQCAVRIECKDIHIKGDSMLVINQLNGTYKVKSDNLRSLHETATELLSTFDTFQLQHIPRELNQVADALANVAIDNNS